MPIYSKVERIVCDHCKEQIWVQGEPPAEGRIEVYVKNITRLGNRASGNVVFCGPHCLAQWAIDLGDAQ